MLKNFKKVISIFLVSIFMLTNTAVTIATDNTNIDTNTDLKIEIVEKPKANEETFKFDNSNKLLVVYRDNIESFKRIYKKEVTIIETNPDEHKANIELNNRNDAKILLNFLTSRNVLKHIEFVVNDGSNKINLNLDENKTITNTPNETSDKITLKGEGTKESPYKISNEAELNNIRYYNSSYFELTEDISLENPWIPIEIFAGKFNGNGHAISNIQFTSDLKGEELGFFEKLYSNAEIISTSFICNSDNIINLNNFKYAGIIAGASTGKIKNCYTEGKLSSGNSTIAGGICGLISDRGSITKCHSNIEITEISKGYAGGIAGEMSKNSLIENCYSKGAIKNVNIAGGICGKTKNSEIKNTYTNIEINSEYTMGIYGETEDNSKDKKSVIKNSYYNSDKLLEKKSKSKNKAQPDSIGKSDAQMKSAITYDDWDFENAWKISEAENDGFPTLNMTTLNTFNNMAGSGTEADPYLVQTKYDLDNVRLNMNAYYKQTADIIFDAADFEEGGDFYNNGEHFAPIGYGYYDGVFYSFHGNYDGQNYIIKNLSINSQLNFGVGLFGIMESAIIKNIHLRDSVIKGNNTVGGIVGCAIEAEVRNCSFSGSAEGTNEVAGIAGGADCGVTIDKCVNYGLIIGETYVGGISGYMANSIISNSFNIGTIKGNDKVGGLNGEILEYYDASIRYSYNIGEIDCQGTNKGGILGCNVGNNDIVNNYYLENSSYSGAVDGDRLNAYTPLTESQMRIQGSFIGLDFTNIWTIDNTAQYKYPTLISNPIDIPEPSVQDDWENAEIINGQLNVPFLSKTGEISTTNLQDLYVYIPVSNGEYKFTISNQFKMEIYEKAQDNSMVLLADNTNGNITLNVTSQKSYYIKIYSNSGSTGTYTFKIINLSIYAKGREFIINDGNVVYYTNYKDGGKLYKDNTTFTAPEVLYNNLAMWLVKVGNYIYFSSNGLYRIDVNTKATELITADVNAFYLISDGINLYYSNWNDNGKIYKHNISTNDKVVVCQNEGSWLELKDDYIYYKNGHDMGKMYKIIKTSVNAANGEQI